MDKITTLSLSFDRVLIQLIVPGLTAVLPWFIIFLNNEHRVNDYFTDNPSVMITVITLISLVVGLFLENLGSWFEVKYLDSINIKNDEEYKAIWNKFLLLTYEVEPVGHRYLRNILLRMKFEISLGIGLLPMMIGLIVLNFQNPFIDNLLIKIGIIYLLPILISAYLLFKEAKSSSNVLAVTRKLLVRKYYK